uniref:Uncharacterized protein n=1 Tax=Terrapene triunguis TaxID=2587831 RepID=A0A674IXL7_9SAUR
MGQLLKRGLGVLFMRLFLPTDSEDRENLTKNRVTHILSVHNNARPVLESEKVIRRKPRSHLASPISSGPSAAPAIV